MSTADTAVWVLALAAVGIALLNPGGMVIGAAIAIVLLGGRYGLPFIGDLVKERQRGVGAAKHQRQIREKIRENDPRDDDRRRRR